MSVPELDVEHWLRFDGLHSVRGVSDGTGALVGTANYDAFGAPRASTGAASAFGFTGEQRDAETGYTYLRSRYYDPGIGRSASTDVVQFGAPVSSGYDLCGR